MLGAATDGRRAPLVLVLSGVQDAGNVGAIVRAAEGGGATGIICTEGTADPFGWKALRGGMGSTFRVPIAVRQPLTAPLDAARAAGLAIVATVPARRHADEPLRFAPAAGACCSAPRVRGSTPRSHGRRKCG